jgi:hypothetical protein
LPKLHIAICGNGVDCSDVLDSKVEHVEGRIPPGCDITGHHSFGGVEIVEDGKPSG